MGLDGLIDVVGQGSVLGVGQIFDVEVFFGLCNAAGGQGSGLGLLVHDIVGVDVLGLFLLFVGFGHLQTLQTAHKGVHQSIQLGGLFALTGDDQRGTGFVDQDGVHLVHDGEGVTALDHFMLVNGHVVAQVVKAKLVVGAVGDVSVIGGLLFVALHAVNDQTHRQAQELIDLAHPFGVTLGQIVVDRDDVHALTAQCIQVGGQGGHQRLAFAGLHFGNAALMQDNAADQLNPVGAHAQNTPCGLAAGGEGFGQNIVQRFTVLQTLLQLGGLGLELGVGQSLVLLFQSLNFIHQRGDGLDLALGVGAEQLRKDTHNQKSPFE